ncbi:MULTISPECIES: ABC transporter permease [Alteribacter]|uniref:ABC transporter permease n=1 Tax=Alteribacter keqinensis TaxID=2483800 RepID=A0A3M7TTG6_9BACI|nr:MULTISPECIES: ABC transporter permease [Alteribacter]MBM7097548.1 ABC transporter permease [Alteribacter salitolerans]RNA68501.1 ABC transporter permease [Alteribacter keqinensis]
MDILQILYTIIPAALIAATPLIFTALGGLFSERSGVVNIGLEGLMVIGAFSGILATLWFESMGLGYASPWIALLVAMLCGALFSLFHAVASITLRADQIVSGVALNFLAVGLAVFTVREIFDRGQTDYISARIFRTNVPFLSDIPIIGPMFFSRVYATTYIAIILAVVVWYVVFKTPFGLRLRSVGEHPMAADTMGIKVNRMRYIAVMLSGAFAGVGGAVFAITTSANFAGNTIVGQGFMALAALIFGKWHPFGALGAAIFFGLAQALSLTGQQIPALSQVPQVYLLIAPYVLTILALAGFVGKAHPPNAIGKPYEKGSR